MSRMLWIQLPHPVLMVLGSKVAIFLGSQYITHLCVHIYDLNNKCCTYCLSEV